MPNTVELAEALATNCEVSLAKELSIFQVAFEGACLRIIQAIINREACQMMFGHIIKEICSLHSIYSTELQLPTC